MSRLTAVARRIARIPATGMPRGELASRAVVGAHVVRRAFASGEPRGAVRRALADATFFEITRWNFGWNSMIRNRHGFFPHVFMPDYHGPQFHEAMRRVSFPGLGPNVMYFSLTGACPCFCEYCFAGAGGHAPPDVGDAGVLEVARAVARLRVPLVNISGGEPLAKYDRLLATVRALREGSEVRMFTTGIGLTDWRLAELREAGLKGVFVSLDGPDEASFDRDRGRRGAHRDAMNALRTCARAGMLTFVNTVVGRQRFTDDAAVSDFLDFVARIDPQIVVNFLPQLATGRGTDADSFRTPAECEPVAERIVAVARRENRPVAMLFGQVDQFIGCLGAGGKLMNVDIHGNVTVCISRAAIGNVLKEPFEEIYQRFVGDCGGLKIGFFCCDVAADTGARLLDRHETGVALGRFHAETPDALWQRAIDRHGWLVRSLLA